MHSLTFQLNLKYVLLFLQSPVELLNGLAQGSKTLIGSTVYAVSSATSHFSKTAYKVFMLMTSLIIEGAFPGITAKEEFHFSGSCCLYI